MACYIVTGKLGGGKSLVVLGRMIDALQEGKRVATNIDIFTYKMHNAYKPKIDGELIRLPDKPGWNFCPEKFGENGWSADESAFHDFEIIGYGNRSADESKNGILALDELGSWLNARSWNDKSRAALIEWFLHARKRGWDVYLIIQDLEMLDKQVISVLGEHCAFCRRTDRVAIPFIGAAIKFFTHKQMRLPRVHLAKVHYGTSPRDMVADRWTYRGNDLFKFYNTKQIFSELYEAGAYCPLTRDHCFSYLNKKPKGTDIMRLTKIYLRKYSRAAMLMGGVLIGGVLMWGSTVDFSAANESIAVDPVQEGVEREKLVKKTTVETLESLVYSGWKSINGEKTYFFTHPVYGRIASDDILFKRSRITEVSECLVSVYAYGKDILVPCPTPEKVSHPLDQEPS